jgi:hypothetical protein
MRKFEVKRDHFVYILQHLTFGLPACLAACPRRTWVRARAAHDRALGGNDLSGTRALARPTPLGSLSDTSGTSHDSGWPIEEALLVPLATGSSVHHPFLEPLLNRSWVVSGYQSTKILVSRALKPLDPTHYDLTSSEVANVLPWTGEVRGPRSDGCTIDVWGPRV